MRHCQQESQVDDVYFLIAIVKRNKHDFVTVILGSEKYTRDKGSDILRTQ